MKFIEYIELYFLKIYVENFIYIYKYYWEKKHIYCPNQNYLNVRELKCWESEINGFYLKKNSFRSFIDKKRIQKFENLSYELKMGFVLKTLHEKLSLHESIRKVIQWITSTNFKRNIYPSNSL